MSIPPLRNHAIVCGAGPTARTIIEELEGMKKQAAAGAGDSGTAPGRDYIVCDYTDEGIGKLLDIAGPFHYLTGDVTDDKLLEQAGVSSAFGIFCVLPAEKDNVCVALAARQKNPSIRIVCGTADPFVFGQKLSRAGANAVISPNFIGGLRIVSEAARPDVTAFLDEMLRNRNPDLQIQEIRVEKGSDVCGRSLAEASIPARTGLLVIALQRNSEKDYLYNPPASTRIDEGDTLVVMGGNAQTASLQRMAGTQG